DIATGTGAFATGAGQRIRPGGRVQAIDMTESMLNKAETNTEKMALDNIDFHVMDAEQLEFRSNYFDAIGCSFGLFFLRDMSAALENWLRILKPGGRLMFTSFGPSALQPMTTMLFEDLRAVGLALADGETGGSASRLPSRDYCCALLEDAGYTNVTSESQQLGFHLGNADEWWEVVWNAGLRGYIERLEAEQQADLRARHLPRIEKLRTEEGIWMDVETWFSGGLKPEA
ncbi:MAG: class I SAM-dependent methyltransferase, partial [Acidiferrobacterales bacterium]|nr:class I SAM-dependent methyltransferase [Acidiferrobacterales bacterium]